MDMCVFFFFFSSRRRHTRFDCDWSSDVCSSDLGRSWPVTSPPRPPSAPRAPAAMPNRTQSRRVMPFSFSSSSQLIETTSSERSRQADFRPTNLVNQLVRHELFAIDADLDREEEEH